MRRLLLFLCVVLQCQCVATAVASPADKPNILVILTDDQGRGDYSEFDPKGVQTPHMDRLFREGMTFNNFYANCCVCSPTRAALLTGCYPDRVGVPGVIRDETPDASWGCLSPRAVLLPQLLKPAGYHTAIIGKWHLGLASPNTPTERGFDFFHGFLGDMLDNYWTHRRHGHNFMRRNLEEVHPQGHQTDVFTDWACAYLKERAEAGRPFFLYLAYTAPHAPIQPPPEWVEKVKRREPGISEKLAKYYAFIEHLDAGIGKVLDALDRTGLAANTLVIFTSDNGGVPPAGANNGPWRSGKTHMYEGGLRVPGAVRWPGVVAPGGATDRVTLTMDIFPTVCAAAGVAPPPNLDGVSFLPELRGESPLLRRDLYFVRREGYSTYCGKTIVAFRRGDWKLVQDNPFAPLELYDLKSDPQETTDLAKAHRIVLGELAVGLCKQTQRAGSMPWQAPEPAP